MASTGTGSRPVPTSAEAIHQAGLNFEVMKAPLFTRGAALTINDSGEILESDNRLIANHFATLRTYTHQVLGVVGKDYQVVQNADAFQFFDAIVGGDGIFMRPQVHWAWGNAYLLRLNCPTISGWGMGMM